MTVRVARLGFALPFALVLSTVGCGDNNGGDLLLGGDNATISDRTAEAFTHALPTLDPEQFDRHTLGRAPFSFFWTPPQLGPLFNHSSCIGCHVSNGRGQPKFADGDGSPALIRISSPTGTPDVPGGQVPVPELGLQLQDHALGRLPEAFASVTWLEHAEQFDDGESISLREPVVMLRSANGAPLPTMDMSFRQAPPLVGMGLLDAIAAEEIVAGEDPDDRNGDGISGRANLGWDFTSASTQLGRFGHKASVPRLIEQVAGAFVNDMGLTNELFLIPNEQRDVPDQQLRDVMFHVATLAVPAAAPRDANAARGRQLFDSLGCAACHTPLFHTAADAAVPQLANQTIRPFTDLLLHDMGEGLADHRGDFLATGSEWRTAPLWGLGITHTIDPEMGFLHDGRARSFAEAILWHGGEATAARDAFRRASRTDRDALAAFLATL